MREREGMSERNRSRVRNEIERRPPPFLLTRSTPDEFRPASISSRQNKKEERRGGVAICYLKLPKRVRKRRRGRERAHNTLFFFSFSSSLTGEGDRGDGFRQQQHTVTSSPFKVFFFFFFFFFFFSNDSWVVFCWC